MASLRTLGKGTVFALCLIIVSPFIVVSRIERLLWSRDLFFGPSGQLLALLPGLPGIYLRAAYYFGTLQRCSWKVHIGFGSVLVNWPAKLAEHVTLGSYCVLGHVDIARGVRIASRVSIPSGRRQHLDESGRLTAEAHFDTVRIGEGSWIGEGAIVLADIGHHAVVSAGAVVVEPVAAHAIVGGNPARVIGAVEPAPDMEATA